MRGLKIGKKIVKAVTPEVVSQVTDIVDRFVTNPEEKEKVREAVENEVTTRWEADMDSDSWLSKNVRPLVLIVVVASLILLTFFDGFGAVTVDESWVSLWEMLSVTVVGGYFAVRTIDKKTFRK